MTSLMTSSRGATNGGDGGALDRQGATPLMARRKRLLAFSAELNRKWLNRLSS